MGWNDVLPNLQRAKRYREGGERMTTNKEWLYSLDPHALTEWFDAEHDSNDTLAAKKVVSVHTGTANDANVSTHVEDANGTSDGARAALDAKFDSREKLEADASELTADYAASGDVCDALYGGIVGLLDRQAAITEQEHRNHAIAYQLQCDEKFAELTAKCYELQAEVDELTEQRDRWRENWNRRNVEYSDLVNEYEELRDEKTNLESTLDVILDALADYWLPDER